MSGVDSPSYQAEHISDALDGRRVGGGFKAHCPAHEDRTPSLAISVRDGKVLVHCHAGCEQEAVLEALRGRGLWPEKESARPTPPGKPDVPRYWYRAPNGQPLAYKERYDRPNGKWCEWFRPDGTKGLNGHKPLLYRAERLQKTPKNARIFVVEGEKCVHALEHLGLVGVCGPHGSSSWDPKWAAFFEGRPVVLLPDNDDPGRSHMQAVADSLKSKAAWVKWLELPDLGRGEDVADWMMRGGDARSLNELANEARYCSVPTVPRLLTLPSMLDVEAEEIGWLWEPYIPIGKLTILEGDPGVRKSWLSLMVTTAVSCGARLPGDPRDGVGPERTLLLIDEDGLGDTVRPRLQAMNANLRLIRPVLGMLHEREEWPLTLTHEGIEALAAEIEESRPSLVVIDPLIAYTSGKVDTNSAIDVRMMLRPLTDMAQKHGVAILALRHFNKAMGTSTTYRGQGSIDYFAAARSVLAVGVDKNDPARSIMAVSKSSLAQHGPSQAFRVGPGPNGAEFLWDGEANMSLEEMLAPAEDPTERSALDEAKAFLRDSLHEGSKAGKEVQHEAREAGISEKTLWRAKTALGVHAKKEKVSGGRWLWELPLLGEKDDRDDRDDRLQVLAAEQGQKLNSAKSANSANDLWWNRDDNDAMDF